MHIYQLLRPVDLVVLFDLIIIDLHLLADLCAAVGQQVFRYIEGGLGCWILFHLLFCLAGTEDFSELVFLVLVLLLLLFLALEQFLFKHMCHLLPDLLRDKWTH